MTSLTALVRGLFSDATLVEVAVPALADETLFAEERAFIGGAVDKRRAEFATARQCARRAFARLGVEAGPLVPAASGALAWPAGVVGSLSHTAGVCVAVIERSPPCVSLGVDVECRRLLEPGVVRKILTPRERSWLELASAAERNDLALVHFGAKEAYYKCQYPLTQRYLGFADVELELEVRAQTFVARTTRPGVPAQLAELHGRYAMSAEHVVAGVRLAQASPSRTVLG